MSELMLHACERNLTWLSTIIALHCELTHEEWLILMSEKFNYCVIVLLPLLLLISCLSLNIVVDLYVVV